MRETFRFRWIGRRGGGVIGKNKDEAERLKRRYHQEERKKGTAPELTTKTKQRSLSYGIVVEFFFF